MKRRSLLGCLGAPIIVALVPVKAEPKPAPLRHFFANWYTGEGQWREAMHGKVFVDGIEIQGVHYIDSRAGLVKTLDSRTAGNIIGFECKVRGVFSITLKGRVEVFDTQGNRLNDACIPPARNEDAKRPDGLWIDVRELPERDPEWYVGKVIEYRH